MRGISIINSGLIRSVYTGCSAEEKEHSPEAHHSCHHHSCSGGRPGGAGHSAGNLHSKGHKLITIQQCVHRLSSGYIIIFRSPIFVQVFTVIFSIQVCDFPIFVITHLLSRQLRKYVIKDVQNDE